MKAYDQAYFDRWYRDPRWRAGSRGGLKRKVAMVVAMAEYHLGHEVRNVLDVGCGEALWRAPLRRLRPDIDYLGLDASEYAVARHGRRRNIRLARFGQLGELRFEQPFDLIVCSDVLHYVGAKEVREGLSGFAELLRGMAYVELYTRNDRVDGDTESFIRRSAAWYRKVFRDSGLTACGSHCYLSQDVMRGACALEVCPSPDSDA